MLQKIHVTLLPSKNDSPLGGIEYQKGLAEFYKQLPKDLSYQRYSFAMDSIDYNTVLIVGKFVFTCCAPSIINQLGSIICCWLKLKSERKVSLEFDGMRLVASNPKELEEILDKVQKFKETQ